MEDFNPDLYQLVEQTKEQANSLRLCEGCVADGKRDLCYNLPNCSHYREKNKIYIQKTISKKISYRYSGQKSTKFWNIVNSLDDASDRQEMYSLGVALQNLESFVLNQLSNATNHKAVNKCKQ